MKPRIINIKKLTKTKWLNLFRVQYVNSKGKIVDWFFSSRKDKPIYNNKPDAVFVVPIVNTPEGKKLVIIKEYRVLIDGYEYGFPAGLMEEGFTIEAMVKKELKEETGLDVKKIIGCSNKLYSSPGLSDESCIVVFAEVEGELSNKYQEDTEDIEAFLYGVKDVRELLGSDKIVGAKAWGILYGFATWGDISYPSDGITVSVSDELHMSREDVHKSCLMPPSGALLAWQEMIAEEKK
jgi:ADP-ribose pyrophosphatase